VGAGRCARVMTVLRDGSSDQTKDQGKGAGPGFPSPLFGIQIVIFTSGIPTVVSNYFVRCI